MLAPTTGDVNLSQHQSEISPQKITRALWEMMMTAFEITYRCGVMELNLKIPGVAKPLKRLETQCLPGKFIRKFIYAVDYSTDKAGPPFENG
jgi:hypothetical protein